jgi:hypothetical protein
MSLKSLPEAEPCPCFDALQDAGFTPQAGSGYARPIGFLVVERDGRHGVVSWDWMTDRSKLPELIIWSVNSEHLVRLIEAAEKKMPPKPIVDHLPAEPPLSLHWRSVYLRKMS